MLMPVPAEGAEMQSMFFVCSATGLLYLLSPQPELAA